MSLDVLARSGDVGQVAAGAVLAALGLAGGAAGVHQKERGFGRHGHRVDPDTVVVLQNVVDDEVAPFHQGGRSRVFARIALPDEHLLDLVAGGRGGVAGLVGLDFMVQQLGRRGGSRPW